MLEGYWWRLPGTTVPWCLRNPLYHWAHLELKRYFGIDKLLNADTSKEIYEKSSEMINTLKTRRAEFHGLCPWVNGNSPEGRRAKLVRWKKVLRALPVGFPHFSSRNIMRKINIKIVCTSDDLTDLLEHHVKIAEDGFEIKVLPTW